MDLEKLRGKLIVSCQALDDEPLHSSFIMGKMALAAKIGGAS
ncbi:MAG: N-acetylmannosamine-6-phosphate 2-epimerase, partial [Anaerococcus vaginalis]|nr:N-acetylmannosamine-6-phosphate 2-epimerase [Anaerococcus vaginalis]